MTLQTERVQTLADVRAVIDGNDRLDYQFTDREAAYEFIRRTLVRFDYPTLSKPDKGVIGRYLAKMTGLSRAQMTRLVGQHRATGRVTDRRGGAPVRPFERRYTGADTLSDVDNAALLTGMSGADAFDPVEIDSLDWHGFEHWVVDRARESGDWEASETPRSGDGGADALLRHRRRQATVAVVQAKHTTERDRLTGEAAVRDLLRARDRYQLNHPQLVAITNAVGFTEGARALALEHDVALVDRDRLPEGPALRHRHPRAALTPRV